MEKLTLRSRFALLLMILIAPFAGVSAAGLLDLNNSDSAAADTHAAANSAVNTTVNTSGTANTATNGTANVNGSVNTNTSVKTNTNVTNGTSNGTTGSVNAAGNVTGQSNSQGAEHANVNGLDNASEHSALEVYSRDNSDIMGNVGPEVAATNVQTDSDLKSFAATSLRNDENLNAMGFSNDQVEVGYREPARLLGIIPTSVNVDVVAHQDGSIDINYPWYSFLMVTNRSDLDASVRNEVGAFMSQNHASAQALDNANGNSALNASTTASSTTAVGSGIGSSWSASLRAELAARIAAILRTHLEGSGSASTTQSSY